MYLCFVCLCMEYCVDDFVMLFWGSAVVEIAVVLL